MIRFDGQAGQVLDSKRLGALWQERAVGHLSTNASGRRRHEVRRVNESKR
jgi:hypothetical protein